MLCAILVVSKQCNPAQMIKTKQKCAYVGSESPDQPVHLQSDQGLHWWVLLDDLAES